MTTRPLVAAEGRRRGDARQAGEHRPHAEQGQVLDFADAAGLAGKDEVADRHASRIEAHHEGRYRVGRHEGPGAIDVADRFGHRLGHVRSGVEVQLHQGEALNVPGLDVVDAGDVEEMILVVVGEKAFHLRRVHAAVRLADVDHRQIEAGEDIDGHLLDRQQAAQADCDQRNDHGNGSSEREQNKVHSLHACGRRFINGGVNIPTTVVNNRPGPANMPIETQKPLPRAYDTLTIN